MKLPAIVISLALLVAAIALSACQQRPIEAALSPVVKIIVANGHGSGVSIGNGIIITAAHVVGDLSTVKLKSAVGDIQPAEVLWVSKKYDIAYLKASNPKRLGTSSLACREPAQGETIIAKGNPLGVEFVSVWGHVAGPSRPAGPWASVMVTDITTVPGQSGGPVYDAAGMVVGITVGVMVAPLGFGASLAGIGYVVPASAVCDLLARAV